ncbi:unnamed protein product [Parnassius apollo]|uniref:(apollo) hypothetical protein n=1 Tax=Parnassius apollo TaxID=110799 RepID=A0A8S3WP71_PARAO|nr:unnamed protein product [Parnassius apollo]
MLNKCDYCSKNITKSKPGLECNRCEKLVHLNNQCTGLTNKQLAALKASENLEWNCQDCQEKTPRRSSIVIPNDDEDDEYYSESPTIQIEVKKLLGDTSKEVERAIKKEMKDLTQSLQFQSDKMDELLKNIEIMQDNISNLQKKNTELNNNNNNLETRVGALEQRIQEIEQQSLHKNIEIHNIPYIENENLPEIVGKVAIRLNQNACNVKQMKRLTSKNDRPRPVMIELNSEQTQLAWLAASKSISPRITAQEICSHNHSSNVNTAIFICEALTQYNKQLLYYAKQELKNSFRYIWIKKGVLRVRRARESQKPIIIRSADDVKRVKLSTS